MTSDELARLSYTIGDVTGSMTFVAERSEIATDGPLARLRVKQAREVATTPGPLCNSCRS